MASQGLGFLSLQEAFAKYVDVNSMAERLAAPKVARLTPKAFMHSITQKCQANPQHIILPEVLALPRSNLITSLCCNLHACSFTVWIFLHPRWTSLSTDLA